MGKMTTPVFRVSFPSIFKLNERNSKYEVTMLFSADTKEMTSRLKLSGSVKALQDEVERVARDQWGTKLDDPKFREKIKFPFHDGTEKEYDGYGEGVVFAASRSNVAPTVVDTKMVKLLSEQDLYAGCYAIASINVYATDAKTKEGMPLKCVSLGLGNIQKVGEGEPFSGRSRVEEDFTPIEEPTTNNDTKMDLSDL